MPTEPAEGSYEEYQTLTRQLDELLEGVPEEAREQLRTVIDQLRASPFSYEFALLRNLERRYGPSSFMLPPRDHLDHPHIHSPERLETEPKHNDITPPLDINKYDKKEYLPVAPPSVIDYCIDGWAPGGSSIWPQIAQPMFGPVEHALSPEEAAFIVGKLDPPPADNCTLVEALALSSNSVIAGLVHAGNDEADGYPVKGGSGETADCE